MLAAIAFAAALPALAETAGVDMSCGVAGAHLTLWKAEANGATRSVSADAKPGETVVVDLAAWTATAKPVLALKPTEYGYQSINGENGARQSAVLDCAAPNTPPLRLRMLKPRAD